MGEEDQGYILKHYLMRVEVMVVWAAVAAVQSVIMLILTLPCMRTEETGASGAEEGIHRPGTAHRGQAGMAVAAQLDIFRPLWVLLVFLIMEAQAALQLF
jgi:hypothetical protein